MSQVIASKLQCECVRGPINGMPKRNLHIVNPNNPLFGICERCNARFTSFAYNQKEADKQVRAAFDEHKCYSDAGQNNPGPKVPEGGS